MSTWVDEWRPIWPIYGLQSTIGIEVEVALADERTMALAPLWDRILSLISGENIGFIKPELMRSQVEIVSGVCSSIAEAHADLAERFTAAEAAAGAAGARLLWSGTHPFSRWGDQVATENARYAKLMRHFQDTGRQLVIFGMHVHVGVAAAEAAIQVCNGLAPYLPLFLALSCNSPWWEGRRTGLLSHRSRIIRQLPTADLAPPMQDWGEYVSLVNRLLRAGFIQEPRDLWWPVRPRPEYGTVEIRVCDTPGCLLDVLAIAFLVRRLVAHLACTPAVTALRSPEDSIVLHQNLWRAQRYGLDATLEDLFTGEQIPARRLIEQAIATIEPAVTGDEQPYLARLRELASGPTWAERQLRWYAELGEDPAALVRHMTSLSRVSPGGSQPEELPCAVPSELRCH